MATRRSRLKRLEPKYSFGRGDVTEVFLRASPLSKHPKLGDLAIVKMFETGFKRTGDIQPARISAEAKAGNTSQLYAKRLYLPDWRKETIERIQRAEREEDRIESVNRRYAACVNKPWEPEPF
jgi:hypothetical protein